MHHFHAAFCMRKVKVRLHDRNGWLKLRWSHQGQRYDFALGLPSSALNRKVAERKASEIELDIATEHFDPSLDKYRSVAQIQTQAVSSALSVVNLFEKFMAHKSVTVYPQTLIKYEATLQRLKDFFGQEGADGVNADRAEAFRDWFAARINESTQKANSATTVKERVTLLSACWDWAIESELLTLNPWKLVARRIKPAKTTAPNPFNPGEVAQIITGFRTDPYYAYYSDYVEFMMGSGCRPGEVIALKWRHVAEDCLTVWIGEAYYRGMSKETKNTKSGTVPLSHALTKLLLKRKPARLDPEALVFPAPKGGHIHDQDFRNRAWKKVLGKLDIPYRKPYTTRSTLISYWLSQGEDPMTVAKLTRTSVKTIYEHYAGSIKSNVRLPDILEIEQRA
jgi:integrase